MSRTIASGFSHLGAPERARASLLAVSPLSLCKEVTYFSVDTAIISMV